MGNKRMKKKKAKMRENSAIQTALKSKIPEKTAQAQESIPASPLSAVAKHPEIKENAKTCKPSLILQYGGKQTGRDEILHAVKQWWKEQGNMIKDMKEVNLYVKPEEETVYFTINSSVQGSLPIPFTK